MNAKVKKLGKEEEKERDKIEKKGRGNKEEEEGGEKMKEAESVSQVFKELNI